MEDARRAALKGGGSRFGAASSTSNLISSMLTGNEAGGHGGADAASMFVWLQLILREFKTNGGPLVVAAGGISTGA